ncbi:MAG TPA: hypothetical protein VMB71_08435 [Acetobacteraceae bacterium]|nr:hypothetical protein [Acetobacteraceae bacterium]
MLSIAAAASAQQQRHPKYDYPTSARADYVIGCLMDHQFKHEFLDPCSCRIDAIADQMTFDQFDDASTVIGVQRNGGMGRANALFRDTPVAHKLAKEFHAAEAKAEQSCPMPQSN